MLSAIRAGFVDFGNDRTTVLKAPAPHHLSGGLTVCRGDADDHRILESAAVATVAV